MKSSIYIGFKQEALIKNNLSLDDGFILRALKDMYSSAKTVKDNNNRMWVKQDYLQSQIPICGSLRTLQRKLEKLESKGFIECSTEKKVKDITGNKKKDIGGTYFMVRLCKAIDFLDDYDVQKTNLEEGIRQVDVRVYDKVSSGYTTKCRSVDRSNKDRSNKDIKIKYHDSETVLLSKIEYEKLIKEHGEDDVKKMIEILDNYKLSSGKKYKSDYRAILNWVVGRLKEDKYRENKYNGNFQVKKLVQSTNYEQRKYDDEFFDNLYDNVEYVKE